LFQHTVTDKIREKYRKRWLDIAREVTVRERQIREAARTEEAVGCVKESHSWHSALSPTVEVSNLQLTEALRHLADSERNERRDASSGVAAQCQDPMTMMMTMTELATQDTDTAWWGSLCSGDVTALQGMMARGFEWNSLTFGEF
jgi:hypothetical protein